MFVSLRSQTAAAGVLNDAIDDVKTCRFNQHKSTSRINVVKMNKLYYRALYRCPLFAIPTNLDIEPVPATTICGRVATSV